MKTYNYIVPATKEALEFAQKPTNLKLRRDSLSLINKFVEFADPYTRHAAAALEGKTAPVPPLAEDFKGKKKNEDFLAAFKEYEKEFVEFKPLIDKYNQKVGYAMSLFLLDEENLQEVFSQFLDGDLTKIDFNVENDDDCRELITLGTEVLTDFFEKGRSLMNVFR